MSDRIDLIIKLIEEQKENTDDRLRNIDKNLAEHMRRTDILEQLHRDNQARIAMLEEPGKALKFIKKTAIYVSVVAGSVLTVLKLLGEI